MSSLQQMSDEAKKQLQQYREEAQDVIPRVLKKYELPPATNIAYKHYADLELTFANADDAQKFSKFIVAEKNSRNIAIFCTVSGSSFSTYTPRDLMSLLNTLDAAMSNAPSPKY